MIGTIELSGVGVTLPLRGRPGELKSAVLRARSEGRSFWALRDVSLHVGKGEVIGIVGANGAGKTTLLRTIAGIFRPDAGTVMAEGRKTALLSLGAGFRDELSGLENIRFTAALYGYSRADLRQRLEQIIAFSGLSDFVHEPLRVYSYGMRVRLGLAVALGIDPDILLIDDIFGVGDETFQQRSMQRIEELAKGQTTVVFVSHNALTLERMCPRAVLLSAGRITLEGTPQAVLTRYREDAAGSVL